MIAIPEPAAILCLQNQQFHCFKILQLKKAVKFGIPDAQITSFRLLAGEDASCLNLYRPEKPRILGVPQKQIDRGGFEFQEISSKDSKNNPWSLLDQILETGSDSSIR